MALYTFPVPASGVDPGQLATELAALPLDTDGSVRGPTPDALVIVKTTRAMTSGEQANASAIVAAHVPLTADQKVIAQAVATFQTARELSVRRDRGLGLAAGKGDNAIRAALATVAAALNTLVAAIVAPGSTLATIKTAAGTIGTLTSLPQLSVDDMRAAATNQMKSSDADAG